MDRMLDYQEHLKADIQLDSYDQAMGEFGKKSYKLVDAFWGFNIEVAKVFYLSPSPYL